MTAPPSAIVVAGPGTNRDRDAVLALELAGAAGATDVRLDASAMKGQALIAERNWDEAEAVLTNTIALAQEHHDRYHEAVALVNLGTAHLFRNRFVPNGALIHHSVFDRTGYKRQLPIDRRVEP